MKNKLKVTFLGTGTSQGVPIIGSTHPVCLSKDPRDKRLRVSVLLEWENASYVIDCGPDFRQQLLRENVSRVDGVLLTHEHSDHVAGLDDIRPLYFKQGNISFFAEKRVFEALYQRFSYVFASENKYPGAPTIDEYIISENESFDISEKEVQPIRAYHSKLPILGYRIDNFTYLTDVKTISENEIEKCKGTEVLVLNALREEAHHSHLSIAEALAIVEKIQPKKTYFTHISHLLGFHEEVEKTLPKNVHLAYDGLKLELP